MYIKNTTTKNDDDIVNSLFSETQVRNLIPCKELFPAGVKVTGSKDKTIQIIIDIVGNTLGKYKYNTI